MPTRRRMRQGLVLTVLMASAVLCAAAGRRPDSDGGDRPDGGQPVIVQVVEVPRPDGRPGERDRDDLMTFLAGSRGASVFDPGGWGVFSPGGFGVFDPGGWGLFDEGTWSRHEGPPRDSDDRPGDRGRGGPGSGPEGRRPEAIFDPGGWGFVPLLVLNKAELSVREQRGVVALRIEGKDRRAVQMIHLLVRTLPGSPRFDGRGRDDGGRGRGDDDRPGPGGPPDFGDRISVEILQNGAVLRMQGERRGGERLEDAVRLQVDAVEKLANAVAASMELNRLLRSRRVEARWERRGGGAALVFTGPDGLREAAGKLEQFGKYLDSKANDIADARRRTAHYFRPDRPDLHLPPPLPPPGPGPR